jgi:4-amino-4-deoxy-L-arabinose transferase-like glycosyltransferase
MEPEPKSAAPGNGWIYRGLLLLAALALAGLYYAYPNAVPDHRTDQAHDPLVYLIYAKSLLAGEGYPTKHWQPGFPLMLAGALAVVGLDFLRLKLLMITLGLATAALSLRFFRGLGLQAAAPVLALLFAATPLYFDYSHRLLSEVPFLAFLVLALVALGELQHAATAAGRWLAGTLLALAGSAAILIRGNALALVPALAVAFFLARGRANRGQRWALAAAMALMVATFGAWTLWGASRQFRGIDNITYLQEVQAVDLGPLWNAGGFGPGAEKVSAPGFARRVFQNVAWHQIYRVDALLWPQADQLAEVRLRGVGLVLALVALVPTLVGSVLLLRHSPSVFTYLVFSLLITVTYPTGGAARMLLPIVPVLIGASYLGLERLLGGPAALGWATCAVFANCFFCAVQADAQAHNPYSGDSTAEVVALVREAVPQYVSPEDTVVTKDYLVVRALTDRSAVPVDQLTGDDRRAGSTYLLEVRSDPIPLPPNFRREVIATRGEAQLSRLSQGQ